MVTRILADARPGQLLLFSLDIFAVSGGALDSPGRREISSFRAKQLLQRFGRVP